MLIIDEIFLVCNRMLTFINCRLRDIKQLHNKFMGCFDVIMTSDFLPKLYQFEIHGFSNQELMDSISLQHIFNKKT